MIVRNKFLRQEYITFFFNISVWVSCSSVFISAEFGLSIQRTATISFYSAVINSSKQTIGLFPKEKIGFDSIVSICPAERLNIMITDWDASEDDLKLFDEKGIEIVIVEKEEKQELEK